MNTFLNTPILGVIPKTWNALRDFLNLSANASEIKLYSQKELDSVIAANAKVITADMTAKFTRNLIEATKKLTDEKKKEVLISKKEAPVVAPIVKTDLPSTSEIKEIGSTVKSSPSVNQGIRKALNLPFSEMTHADKGNQVFPTKAKPNYLKKEISEYKRVPRKKQDKTPLTKPQWDRVMLHYIARELKFEEGLSKREHTNIVTERINKELGLNKHSEVYANIWRGHTKREKCKDAPEGVTYPWKTMHPKVSQSLADMEKPYKKGRNGSLDRPTLSLNN